MELNVDVLNDLIQDLPVVFVRGRVRQAQVVIPWRNILAEHCRLKINGLELIAQPSCEHGSTHASSSFSDLCRSSVLELSTQDMNAKDLEDNIRLHKQLQEKLQQSGVFASRFHQSDEKANNGDADDEGLQVFRNVYQL